MTFPSPKKIALAALSLAAGLLVSDAALTLAARRSPFVAERANASALPDRRLGLRPNPAFPGHDRDGFRNARVPESAEIVAFGDSQTYGAGVRAEEAWPARLEALLGKPVYSIAWGGWGPVHNLSLWDKGAALKPRVVVAALYPANDFFDSFQLVYGQGQWPDLKTADPGELGEIARAQAAEPLADRISRISWMMPEGSSQRFFLARRRLAERFLGLRLLAAARSRTRSPRPPDWEASLAFARARPGYCEAFESGASRTVFTTESRRVGIDRDDPRIREGQRLSLEALLRMKRRADAAGIRFVVLLLPTKELVFAEAAAGRASEAFFALARGEARRRSELIARLSAESVEHADPLAALQDQLKRGPQPYFESEDGHPNDVGHRVIAECLRARLDERGRTR